MKYFSITFDMEAAEIARHPQNMELLEARRERTLPLTLDDDPVDYQPNSLFWRLCSPRLRDILEAGRSPEDKLEWIPVNVTVRSRRLQYFRLESRPLVELLHPDSITAGKLLVKPVLDSDRAKRHRVFVIYEESHLVVIAPVRKEIEAARCTGLVFMDVLTATKN